MQKRNYCSPRITELTLELEGTVMNTSGAAADLTNPGNPGGNLL